jgi:hypothetical protein
LKLHTCQNSMIRFVFKNQLKVFVLTGILIENMRREGFELSVSPPKVMWVSEDWSSEILVWLSVLTWCGFACLVLYLILSCYLILSECCKFPVYILCIIAYILADYWIFQRLALLKSLSYTRGLVMPKFIFYMFKLILKNGLQELISWTLDHSNLISCQGPNLLLSQSLRIGLVSST